jgi:hypothetical protein
LTWDQVTEFDLPPQLGKSTSPRAAAFLEEHGELVQVEADALPPDILRDKLTEAVDEFYDRDAYEAVTDRELRLRSRLEDLVDELDTDVDDVEED